MDRAVVEQATETVDDQKLAGSGITLGQLKRAARMYHRNIEAAEALGMTMRSFGRLCRRHGVQTPFARKQARRR